MSVQGEGGLRRLGRGRRRHALRHGRFVLRGEYSHTALYDIAKGDAAAGTTGSGFGRDGNRTAQDRFMVEGGITF